MFWRRRNSEKDLEKEIRFHLERQIDDLIAQGLEPREARRQARQMLGGLEQTKEACRDERRFRWAADFAQDCRFGLRLLRRSPGFACAAILSLALGIGANTAIFSLIDRVMLRMMPVREPERLVQFQKYSGQYGRGSISYPLFEDLRAELRSFDGLFAHSSQGRKDIRIDGREEKAVVELVSGSYYNVLGIKPAAGQTFDAEIDRAPRAVAVLSNGYWKRRFGGDPAAIGKTFQLNQTAFTIAGVAPARFSGVLAGTAPDITIPLAMDGEVRGGESWRRFAGRNWLSIIGRLRPGVAIQQGSAEVRTFYSRRMEVAARRAPNEREKMFMLGQRLELEPAGNGLNELRERFSRPLTILMGIVTLVLLIACANIANLLLAKSAVRRREIAVRLAIGARQGRIVRQLLTEGLLLSVIGGLLALPLAYWFADALVIMMSNGGPRMALEADVDGRILLFAGIASLAACLIFSLAPAAQASRQGVRPGLAEARSSRWRTGQGLIVAQVAITLMLLIGAGLFGRTLAHMYAMETGFDRHGVLLFSVNTAKAGYSGEQLPNIRDRIVAAFATIPGVTSASVALMPPVSGGGWDGSLIVEGYTHGPTEDDLSHLNSVGPGFFKTLATPMLAGREFDARDTDGATKAAIVNETFARYYFPGRSPIGKRISIAGEPRQAEIVGVVKNMKYRSLRQEFPRTVYFCIQQDKGQVWHTYVARTSGDPMRFTRSMEAALQHIDPKLRLIEPHTLEEHVDRSILTERMLATLAVVFAALALGLALIGIYGVMAFQVARRRKEIGIRLALGALPGKIAGMILGQTARLLLAGCAIGVTGAIALNRVAEKMLFGVKPVDPATFGGAAAVLLLAGLAASYFPGRTATRMNPVETLRCD